MARFDNMGDTQLSRRKLTASLKNDLNLTLTEVMKTRGKASPSCMLTCSLILNLNTSSRENKSRIRGGRNECGSFIFCDKRKLWPLVLVVGNSL